MAAMYLDYCASAPIDRRVLEEMNDVYLRHAGNADSRTHSFGMDAKGVVERGRSKLASILDVDKSEVLFTSGATESDNTALLGIRDYGRARGKLHIVTTAIEHKAVLEAVRALEREGFEADYVRPDASGRVKSEDVLDRVRPDTALVSVMHVNNETGVIQPVSEIGEELKKRGVLFHVDAAQSFGKLNDELRSMKYDMLSISGHKIHGPQGIGALILRRTNYKRPPITQLLYGGQQEYGFRPGTVPVALVAGLCRAAELMNAEYPRLAPRLKRQKAALMSAFSECPHRVNGDPDLSLPNVLNISFAGVDAESVFAALKDEYAISNGSACSSGSYAPSYVLAAMGLDEKRIGEALRISWWNEEIDAAPLTKYVKETAI